MKKIVIAAVLLAVIAVQSGGQTRAYYLELLGPSTFAGLWCDSRFSGNSGFGYGAGIAFVPGQTDDIGRWTSGTWSLGLPVAVNYLFGRGNGHIEAGAGIHNSLMKKTDKKLYWGYYLFVVAGYRYQAPGGFLFRAGLSPNFHFGDSRGITKRNFYPYMAFGWAF